MSEAAHKMLLRRIETLDAKITEAAAFLDGLADSLQPWWEPGADDCRKMAARLRGGA